jgi:hypothetical protein
LNTPRIRNLAGGFVGGIAGILLGSYLNPLAIPLGVLLGVIIGWWHREIADVFVTAFHRAGDKSLDLVTASANIITAFGNICGLPSGFTKVIRVFIARILLGTIVGLVLSPVRFYCWFKDFGNRVTLSRMCAITVCVIACSAISWRIIPDDHRGSQLLGILIGMLIGAFGVAIYTSRGAIGVSESQSLLFEMRLYYREWEIQSRLGTVGHFFYVLAMCLRYSLGGFIFAVIGGGWLFSAFMFGFLGSYPLIIVLGIANGLYQLMKRADHWICFGITFVTTSLAWFSLSMVRRNWANSSQRTSTNTSWVTTRMVRLEAGLVSGRRWLRFGVGRISPLVPFALCASACRLHNQFGSSSLSLYCYNIFAHYIRQVVVGDFYTKHVLTSCSMRSKVFTSY